MSEVLIPEAHMKEIEAEAQRHADRCYPDVPQFRRKRERIKAWQIFQEMRRLKYP